MAQHVALLEPLGDEPVVGVNVRRLIRAALEHLEAVRDESRYDEDLPADADQLFVAHREEPDRRG